VPVFTLRCTELISISLEFERNQSIPSCCAHSCSLLFSGSQDFIAILADGSCSLTSTRSFKSMRGFDYLDGPSWSVLYSCGLWGRIDFSIVSCPRSPELLRISYFAKTFVSVALGSPLLPLEDGTPRSSLILSPQSPCRPSFPGMPSSVPTSEAPH
jgi:hypothetical protein